MRGKWWISGAVLLLVGLAGLAWTQREWLQGWWLTRGLANASEANRTVWIERLAEMGKPAIRPLVGLLTQEEPRVHDNALAAIDHLARLWTASAPSTGLLAHELAQGYAQVPAVVQPKVLACLARWCASERLSDELHAAAVRLLRATTTSTDPAILGAGLDLAIVLCRHGKCSEVCQLASVLARASLQSTSQAVRLRAVQLCLQPGIELLELVAGLLRDESVEVRRAAILAVGPAEQIVREDGLLIGLHDPDPEVRRLTEAALRSRGLRPEHLELGRLISHPQPRIRLQVLQHIAQVLDNHEMTTETDIDPGVWLRRLSHDSSPAVRAAALRLMSQQSLIDLHDRIDQMAHGDPSPTVCQLAQFYLNSRRGGREPQPDIRSGLR
jgi:HEAT repeat protein